VLKKIIAPFLGFGLLASPVLAKEPAAKVRDADPALWVVKDHDTTIYLFGTFHALTPDLGWFDDAVREAFDKSDKAVFELDSSDTATIQAAARRHGFSKDPQPFTAKMSAKDKAAYDAAMAKLGLPPTAFDRLKPWLAAVTLTTLSAQKAGFDPQQGAEATLIDAARKAGKKIGTLETAEEQLSFFDALTETQQIELLNQAVEEVEKPSDTLNRMITYWSEGKPDALGKLINEELLETPGLAKTILFDRNERWAKQIKAMLDTPGTVFVAVGAGHLAGPNDVQDDLAKLGVKAVRVQYD